MALADRIAQGPPPNPRRGCGFGRMLVDLPDSDADAVRDALHDPGWSDTRLAVVLREDGHGHITHNMLCKHRLGLCGCESVGLV